MKAHMICGNVDLIFPGKKAKISRVCGVAWPCATPSAPEVTAGEAE